MEFPPRDLWTTRDAVGDPGETINVCWNASLAARLRDGFDDPLLQAVLHGIFVMIRFAVLAAVSWFMVTVSFYVFVQVCFQRRYRLLRRPGVPATAPRGGRRVLCSGPRQVRAYGRCQAVRVLSAGDLSFHVAGTSSSPIIITHKQVATSVSISWSQAAINVFITSPLAYTVLLGILLPTAVVQPVWFAAMLSVPVWAAARVMLGVAVLLVKTVPTILISAAKTGQRRVVRPLLRSRAAQMTLKAVAFAASLPIANEMMNAGYAFWSIVVLPVLTRFVITFSIYHIELIFMLHEAYWTLHFAYKRAENAAIKTGLCILAHVRPGFLHNGRLTLAVMAVHHFASVICAQDAKWPQFDGSADNYRKWWISFCGVLALKLPDLRPRS